MYRTIKCKKYKGKIIVSIIKTNTNFSNILDEDNIVKTIKYGEYSFLDFIKHGINSGNYGFLMNKFSAINIIKNLKSKEINGFNFSFQNDLIKIIKII